MSSNPKRMYDTVRWRHRSKRQLNEHPLCAMCKQIGHDTPATIADHIEQHNGDPDKFWHGELQSLCATCHSAAKRMEETHGYSQAAGLDGIPLDRNHPWNKGKKEG